MLKFTAGCSRHVSFELNFKSVMILIWMYHKVQLDDWHFFRAHVSIVCFYFYYLLRNDVARHQSASLKNWHCSLFFTLAATTCSINWDRPWWILFLFYPSLDGMLQKVPWHTQIALRRWTLVAWEVLLVVLQGDLFSFLTMLSTPLKTSEKYNWPRISSNFN